MVKGDISIGPHALYNIFQSLLTVQKLFKDLLTLRIAVQLGLFIERMCCEITSRNIKHACNVLFYVHLLELLSA